MTAFIALLRKDQSSDYGVDFPDFPDFPGCVTAGKTLEEARNAAVEALTFHIEGMRDDGDEIPRPSSLDNIMNNPDNQEAVVFIVDIPLSVEKVRRINVTLPEDIVYKIDRITKNRSRFLAQAAREKLDSY